MNEKKSLQEKIKAFEEKYKMNFAEFEKAWQDGKINNSYSYEVEQDYMQWETAIFELNKFLSENINQ